MRCFVATIAAALCACAAVSAESLTYTAGAPVQVFATHVGPMANAMETYPYYNLAWCPAASGSENSVAEGQGITADVHVATGYRFEFGKDVEQATACTVQLTPGDIDAFSRAIEEEWYGELTVDDLPMWFAVGEGEHEDFLLGHTDSSKHWLFTHLTFTLGVNGDRIVTANVSVSMAHRADITTHDPSHADAHKAPGLAVHEASTAPLPVTFTYSVRFVPSDVAYESRQDVYAHSAFMPAALEIHWLSIVNSVVLVMLLTIFLGIILLRVVRNDFTRMLQEADEEVGASMTEETGWKLLHADVFRPPKHANLFAACVGTGIHLFVTALCLLAFGVLGVFSLSRRGSVVMYTIVMYVLTCFLSGYFSARVFKQLRGTNWVWNVVLSIFVFPAPLTACFAVANTTALAKNSTAALPATTILALIATFLFIVMPLTIAGGITGHNVKDVEPVCRVAKVPRQVPERSVLGSLPVQLFIAGFLPFSAISIEMHYILSSIWGHQVYTLFGVCAIAFGLLTLVIAFVTVSLTYFQLVAEDHRWWWRSFLSGGAVGVFIFLHSVYYYFAHSAMNGFLQSAFFFLYMANIAFAFFLMFGAIGYYSSRHFVKYIYGFVKTD